MEVEAGWTRRHAFVELTAAAIERLLQPVFGDRVLESFAPLSGGLANTNYKVWVSGRAQPVVVRLYTRDPGACERDEALFRLVGETVPVPRLLLVDASCSRCELPYVVMEWVEGVLLADVLAQGDARAVREGGYAAGRALAAIGAYRFEAPGFFLADRLDVDAEPAPLLSYIERCLFADGGARRLGTALASQLWRFVQDHAAYFTDIQGEASLAHGDYKGGNILLREADGRWTVAAVLAWEFAFSGPAVFDLGTLLRYSDRLDPAFEPAVLAGFADAGGAVLPRWKRTARFVDIANLCGFLAMPEEDSARVRDITGLLEATMRGWGDD